MHKAAVICPRLSALHEHQVVPAGEILPVFFVPLLSSDAYIVFEQ
jgi:hypothetical protein